MRSVYVGTKWSQGQVGAILVTSESMDFIEVIFRNTGEALLTRAEMTPRLLITNGHPNMHDSLQRLEPYIYYISCRQLNRVSFQGGSFGLSLFLKIQLDGESSRQHGYALFLPRG